MKNTARSILGWVSHACATILVCLCLASCSAPPQNNPALVTSETVQNNSNPSPSIVAPALNQNSPSAAGLSHTPSAEFASVAGWGGDDMQGVTAALTQTCNATVITRQAAWQAACGALRKVPANDAPALTRYFETYFTPRQQRNADGTETGVLTGYYEPLLRGSRSRSARFHTALYRLPTSGVRTVSVPRAELQKNRLLNGLEIVYVDDAVDAFFLQIQGSGRVQLENGEIIRVAFSGHNGQPYQSIGKSLIDWGEMKASDASMQSIKAWVALNPQRTENLFNTNPRFVFFKEVNDVPAHLGPRGALGVPLTPERSIAVDPAFIALGTPVFISSIHPATGAPWQRVVLAQDTGSAIKGAVRADYFFGYGEAAGAVAGKTKQQGRMWALLPKN